MRTVRSAARARNRPRPGLLLTLIVALVMLIVLVARVDAQPSEHDELDDEYGDRDDERDPLDGRDGHGSDGRDGHGRGARGSGSSRDRWQRGGDRASERDRRGGPLDVRRGWLDNVLALDREPCDCDRAVLARVMQRAPRVDAVVAAAYRAAGIARDPTPSWRTRSKLSALVPWLTVHGGNSERWSEVLDPTISHSVVVGARLAWRLDRLVFDPNEARFASYDLGRRRDRRRIASLASRAYFSWIEAAVAADQDPRWALDAARATAELDALTDGWFSETIENLPVPTSAGQAEK